MQEETQTPIKRQKRKRKTGFGYLVLFALVFILALLGLSYLVKSFSPDVDVSIGNTEPLTLNDSDNEIKTVDERLKWIQMEDELPSVAIRTSKDKENKEKFKGYNISEEGEFVKRADKSEKPAMNMSERPKPPKPEIKEIPKQNIETKVQSARNIEPDSVEIKPIKLSKPSKVYVGQYSTVEDAVKAQNKIASEESDIIPFIKKVNGYYVVQAGSFSDKEKALSLTSRLNSKGYKARSVSE